MKIRSLKTVRAAAFAVGLGLAAVVPATSFAQMPPMDMSWAIRSQTQLQARGDYAAHATAMAYYNYMQQLRAAGYTGPSLPTGVTNESLRASINAANQAGKATTPRNSPTRSAAATRPTTTACARSAAAGMATTGTAAMGTSARDRLKARDAELHGAAVDGASRVVPSVSTRTRAGDVRECGGESKHLTRRLTSSSSDCANASACAEAANFCPALLC
jgi:hypothetical protein